jgi:hypothetical protein
MAKTKAKREPAADAKTTKPGRPPGSPNKEYAAAEEIPASCLRCNSTKLTRVEGSKVIDRSIAGKLQSGYVYNRVRHTRKKCECGQTLIVKAYYVAADEPAPPATEPAGIPIKEIVEGKPYQCWCEARQDYVVAELFTTTRGVQKWRIDGDIIARLSALIPKQALPAPPQN